MRSTLVKRTEDPRDISYPHLRVCTMEPSLVVLFTDRRKGMIVSKPMFDDRPMFVERDDWDDSLFEYYEEAILLQNY